MGLEERVACATPPPLARLVELLVAEGYPSMIAMVDGALVMPKEPPPERWQDVRLRTPDGTVAIARREGGVAVLVFGNADERLRTAQGRVLDALRRLAPG